MDAIPADFPGQSLIKHMIEPAFPERIKPDVLRAFATRLTGWSSRSLSPNRQHFGSHTCGNQLW